jgi:uncharacterized protein with PQ loop repeat
MNGMESSVNKDKSASKLVGSRLVGVTRLALSVWALFAIYIDPVETNEFFFITYLILILYILYGAVVCLLDFFRPKALPINILHWIDTFWYLLF